MTEFAGIIRTLTEGGVEFVPVGGICAWSHGSDRATTDVDIVYDRSPENLARLAATLEPLHPSLRGAPPGLPFLWDVGTLGRGLNFTLTTDLGPLDLLGEMAGGGRHGQLLPHTLTVEMLDVECRALTLEALIRAKRAAGRPKDLEAIAELEAIREERDAGFGVNERRR